MTGPSPKRKRLTWRRLIERGSFVRHPVSVVRHRLGATLLVCLAAGLSMYALTTRDEAIRIRAIEFFKEATLGGVDVLVERAHFRLFGGTTLHDVRICLPYNERLDPNAVDLESRTIFSAKSLKLIHNPWYLLLGKLRVERVVAVQPTIILVHNVDTGLHNWELLSDDTETRAAPEPDHRPQVKIRSARAVIVSIDQDGRHEARVEELDADIRPHPQSKTGYYIEVRRYTEPIERTTMLFDPGERLVSNTPFVDAETVRLQLPKPARDLFDAVGLQGEVRLSRLLYRADPKQQRETEIELRKVRCDIPMRLLGPQAPDRNVFGDARRAETDDLSLVRMTDVRGVIRLQSGRLNVDISGRVNDARCMVDGYIDIVDRRLHTAGFDLRFRGSGVPTPEGAIRERLLADADLPAGLRQFFHRYDPHGRLDLDFRFERLAESDETTKLTGTIRPQGASARCIWFPYTVEDLHGEVRFADRRVLLNDLRGRHGSSDIAINGTIDLRERPSRVDLDIRGVAVPIDDELFGALPPHYRSRLERFAPEGCADIHARLALPNPDPAAGPGWKRSVTIEFDDVMVTLPPFPQSLEHVSGCIEVDGDQIQIVDFQGTSGGASIKLDGMVSVHPSLPTEIDLNVEAHDIRLDEKFVAALPAEDRAAFEQFQPEGFVDLSGSISSQAGRDDLAWNLRAKIRDAAIRYEHFPFDVSDVSGEIALKPDHISILDLRGRHGDANIKAGGEISGLRGNSIADLSFDVEDIAFDQELHDALPAVLEDVWRLLKPTGRARVRTGLHFDFRDGHRQRRHRTEIELVDAGLEYAGFPLPLSGLDGRIIVTDRRIEILSLRGRAGGGAVEISGEIEIAPPGWRGTLIIDADNLAFDRDFLDALPAPLGNFIRAANPRGRFELHANPLLFEVHEDKRSRWEFAGRLRLIDTYANLGLELRACDGLLTGRVVIDEAGEVFFDAETDLQRAILNGWHLENIRARIRTDGVTKMLLIEDVDADMYGGDLAAFAEIEPGRGQWRYQASITARGVQLDQYLQTHRRPKRQGKSETNPAKRARGSISGKLVLRGKTGKGGYREGAGEAFVSGAQIWKLPFFFAIFQLLNLTPDENVFHDGRLIYYLSGDQLTFQKIDLQGKALSLIGGGRLDLRTDHLDVTLLAGSPIRLRVPLLSDILEGASREIMEIQVVGNLADPSIRPRPLKSLTKALEKLFPEPPAAARR